MAYKRKTKDCYAIEGNCGYGWDIECNCGGLIKIILMYMTLTMQLLRVEAIREEEQKQIDLIKQYCEKKNLLFKQYYEKIYLIKLRNKDVRKMIENADNKRFEGLRDFMNEHPDNKDAAIVMNGNIEDIVRQIA